MIENVFMYIAMPATVIYVLIILFSLLGMDSTDGLEADFGGDLELEDGESAGSIQIFTVRNLLGFLVGLGWAGLAALEFGFSNLIATLIGIGIGLVMIIIQTSLFYFMNRLSQPNEPSIKSAVGQMGTVYLTIPARRQGMGKVTVIIDGVVRTLNATTSGEEIKTGSLIQVESVLGDALVVSNAVE